MNLPDIDKFRELNKELYNKTTYRSNNNESRKKYYKPVAVYTVYDITLEEFNKKLEEQNSLCYICGTELTKEKSHLIPNIDHDHQTGVVRKILCGLCNKGLGLFNDDSVVIAKAIEYLEKSDGKNL